MKKFSKNEIQLKSRFISNTISKVLISVIFVLSSLIYTNISVQNYELYKKKIINNNIHYPKTRKLYEKYFGKILPENTSSSISVFNNTFSSEKIEDTSNGEKITFENNTVIEAIQSGIVVYLGEKDDLGFTVIIQGIDDTDIWYSNIKNCNLNLYDYVEKTKIIGEVDKELHLKIIKNDKLLKYEEYIKTI